MKDQRSLRELERLVIDHCAGVIWYAKGIHPDRPSHPYGALGPARNVVPGVAHLVKLLAHERFNVRLATVRAVGA